MVKYCCAFGCSNVWRPDRNIQYHRFPLKSPELLDEWVKAVRLANFKPTANTVICSEHFTSDSYSESGLLRKRLMMQKKLH